MTKTEAVLVNQIYLIFKHVHFLVDTSDLVFYFKIVTIAQHRKLLPECL